VGGSIIGGFIAFIAGSAIASATVIGVVSSQTAAPDRSPTQVGTAEIDPTNYGE
jgi:hypothetical protein